MGLSAQRNSCNAIPSKLFHAPNTFSSCGSKRSIAALSRLKVVAEPSTVRLPAASARW